MKGIEEKQTIKSLQEQNAMLFCSVCNLYPHISWKYNDNAIEGKFVAGIYTPLGQASCHLKNKYWDHLKVSEIDGTSYCDDLSEQEMAIRIFSLGELVNNVEKEKTTSYK